MTKAYLVGLKNAPEHLNPNWKEATLFATPEEARHYIEQSPYSPDLIVYEAVISPHKANNTG